MRRRLDWQAPILIIFGGRPLAPKTGHAGPPASLISVASLALVGSADSGVGVFVSRYLRAYTAGRAPVRPPPSQNSS